MITFALAIGLVIGWTFFGIAAAALLHCWRNPVKRETLDSDTEESGW